MKYICELCGLIYDEDAGLPEKGVAPGTKFEALPEDFECPGCYSERQAFYRLEENRTMGAVPMERATPEIKPDVKKQSDR